MSPFLRVITALSALTTKVPWVTITLPVSVLTPSSASEVSLWSACTSIGCRRSLLRAQAQVHSAHSSSASAARPGMESILRGGDIVHAHLGKQFEAVGIEVRVHPDPMQYRCALVSGDKQVAVC